MPKNRTVGTMLLKGEDNPDRPKTDFYPTPVEATLTLLANEEIEGDVWECASGKGHISKILEASGFKVLSTDLIAEEHGYGQFGDFLATTALPDGIQSIVTNPPYKIQTEFMVHGIELQPKILALHLPLQSLLQTGRIRIMQEIGYPKKILVFAPPLDVEHAPGEKAKKSAFNHIWAIWYPNEPIALFSEWYCVDWRVYRIKPQGRLFG